MSYNRHNNNNSRSHRDEISEHQRPAMLRSLQDRQRRLEEAAQELRGGLPPTEEEGVREMMRNGAPQDAIDQFRQHFRETTQLHEAAHDRDLRQGYDALHRSAGHDGQLRAMRDEMRRMEANMREFKSDMDSLADRRDRARAERDDVARQLAEVRAKLEERQRRYGY